MPNDLEGYISKVFVWDVSPAEKVFAQALKKRADTDIKDFWYCLTLFGFLIFPKIFCSGLQS